MYNNINKLQPLLVSEADLPGSASFSGVSVIYSNNRNRKNQSRRRDSDASGTDRKWPMCRMRIWRFGAKKWRFGAHPFFLPI